MAASKSRGAAPYRSFMIVLAFGSIPTAALSFAAATGSLGNKASDTLFRCLERTNFVTMTAIVVQRGTNPTCPPYMQLKVEQVKGKKAVTTLQPLSLQNLKVVHAGQEIKQYYPDENRIVVQPAPPRTKPDFEERRDLAEKNYRFALEKNGVIAGRQTVVVTATPKYSELPTRRYSIDISKDVLLRLETIGDGKNSVFFDTQAVFFPESVNPGAFELKPLAQVRVIKLSGPERINDVQEAREKLGFEPILPKELPFGFVIREQQLTGEERTRFVAVRLTDGLLMATVYQWDPRRLRDPLPKQSLTRTVNGIRIGLIGEIPDFVNARLLDLFAKEAARAFRPASEPKAEAPALKQEQRVRPDHGKDGASDDPGDGASADEALMQTITTFLTALMDQVESQ